ncbi:MAG: chromosomal replication initiator protein DnaA [Deltaproteobacteria bacterium]|nr:chromosomal replication initiator protein DnaA [Deltaproteobacteria bacterium]
MDEPIRTWNEALARFSRERPQQFKIWSGQVRLLRADDAVWILGVPSKFFIEWFSDNYLPLLAADLEKLSGKTPAFKFELLPEDNTPVPALTPPAGAALVPETRRRHPRLNESYSFDRFVVGDSNRLAHSAAISIASDPDCRYNPLYIHGGTGLGKTHLLHAIGHHFFESRGTERSIVYVTSEDFLNQYVSATRPQDKQSGMKEFRERYRRNCDILLVDDIQFISGNKDATQEEFFHTFNDLYETGKRLVITSDRFPKEIHGLEDRLVSRFQGGLIVQIKEPDLPTRKDILRHKAKESAIYVPDEIVDLIAENVESNVRELEGALHHIDALANLTKTTVDLDTAREAIRTIRSKKERILTAEEIIRVVSLFFNVRPQDLKSHRRHKLVTEPRQVAMYLCRKHLKMSFPDIGSHFGGKDHSTVISSVRKVETRLAKEAKFAGTIGDIETRLMSL